MISIPRRKAKVKFKKKIACENLEPLGDVSNSLQPLCYCAERDLVLGSHTTMGAFVCQVCWLYSPDGNVTAAEIYKKSKKMAEQKIPIVKEIEIKDVDLELEEQLELDTSEFDEIEEEESVPPKFRKRSKGSGKASIKKEYGDLTTECAFCGEFFENVEEHMLNCEFAPSEDAAIPRRGRKPKPAAPKAPSTEVGKAGEVCPYCGKTFQRLARHICKKAPKG